MVVLGGEAVSYERGTPVFTTLPPSRQEEEVRAAPEAQKAFVSFGKPFGHSVRSHAVRVTPLHMGTSLIRKRPLLGRYDRPMPMVLCWSQRGGASF